MCSSATATGKAQRAPQGEEEEEEETLAVEAAVDKIHHCR
jgi:hypothetical protein